MKFTLRQLEVFAAIARSGNVSRAAEEIPLSQSATSTALGEFERQVGLQLFDRVGKSLRLNEVGRQLLPRAVGLLDRAHEIEDLLEGRSGFGPLSIGATLTIGNYLTTLIVAKFLQRHPHSQVQLAVHNTSTIVQQGAHYELDLGLIEGDTVAAAGPSGGCAFEPRCPHRFARCGLSAPPLFDIAADRRVACFLNETDRQQGDS